MIKLRKKNAGYVLPVHVTPGASRNELRGEYNGRAKIALSAAPERGKANEALCKFLAGELGVRKSQVRIVSGQTSREKEVLIERVSPRTLDEIIT